MIEPKFFIGSPIAFKEICWVYPPKIKDIVNDDNYSVYRKILMTSQEEIEDMYVENNIPFTELPTPLEYVFLLASTNAETKALCIKAFKFFIHESVFLLPELNKIIVGDLEDSLESIKTVKDLRIIDNDNFFELQNLMRTSIGE